MSEDPTAFSIRFDPTIQRMEGIAIHGNTQFDVPFISQITENLWQGGCETGLVLPEHIDHLVSLYPWERYTVKHELKSETYIRLYDSLDKLDRDEILSIASWVNACRNTGITLVHCQAGLNRSSLIAAAALWLSGPEQMDEIIELIRKKRSPACLCNPNFQTWLLNDLGELG